ncbi:MAG: ABC transporter substrate-binding protein [Candidatus Methanomethylophilaceae archaeon]
MDSKKMMAIVVVAVVAIAAVGGFVYINNDDKGEDVELKVAYLNLGYYPLMIGFQNGWFDDLGFKVTPMVVTGSGNVAVETLTSGAADIAATGDAPYVNAVGKYGNDMVGLCQYTQGTGSLAGHQWIVNSSMTYSCLGDRAVTAIATDANNIVTNSAQVAQDIKDITAAGEGRTNGMFTVQLNNGSTTHTNFMKWCVVNGLSFTTNESQSADVYILATPSATADILATSLDTKSVDAVACNKTLYSNIDSKIGATIHKISDSSAINESSYSILCTTAEKYEKYADEILRFLEVIKKINEWMVENVDEAAKICSELSGATEDSIRNDISGKTHKVIWETDHLDGWVNTAKVNGYTEVTAQTFIDNCPARVRDTINGWYA